MDARNDVILCVDVSGSVDQCEQYFRGIERLIDEFEKICDDLPVICWSSDASIYDVRNFKDTRMKTRQGKGGTQPQYMVKSIDEVMIMRRKTNKLQLVITTDGEMSSCDTSQFCENVRSSHFHDQLVDVQIHFIGNPEGMNTNLAHAFENVSITLGINEHIVRNDRKFNLLKDERFTNFKIENISSLLDDLALEFSVMPSNRKNKVAIRDMLQEIYKKYLKALDEEHSDRAKKPEDVIHQFLAEGKMDQLKNYYCDLFVKEKECIYDRKINKLYNMLFKDSVKCYELMYFIPSAANTECVKKQLASDDGLVFGGDSENEMHCDYDREQFCAMYNFKPTLPVIELQKVPLDGIVDGSVGYPFHEQRKLARCPLQLFEYVDYDNLEETILGDHISAEEFLKLSSNKQPFLNDFTFKSSRNTEAYGIMVYDYPKAIERDLYNDQHSELYKDKSELDENIVNHICCIVADYFLESQEIRGNKGLWAIALLYSIFNTDRIRQNEFLRRCVRYTIIRISLVFKCNLPVFSGVHPHIKTNIHDALCCALHIGSTAFEGQMNFIQKLGESSPNFVEMMKTIFKQHIPLKICLADWLSWRYLFKLSLDMRHRQLLEAIIRTKLQDWINTDSGPLLIEGKTNNNVYNEAIKSSSIETLYKMVKVLQDNKKLVNRNFNHSMLHGIVLESLTETKCLNIDPSEFPKHVKICETTCRPTSICSKSQKPWTECLPSELRKTERSFYNLFGVFSYKYKKYPTLDDMLSYLVSRFPHEVHYRNVKDILTDVIQSFAALNLDVEEFGKRFVASSTKEVRSQLEAKCKCSAHI